MYRLVLLTLLSLSGPLACASAPLNGSPPIASTATQVTFSGFSPLASTPVEIEVSSTKNAGWTQIASTLSSAQATTFWDGTKMYAFSVKATVPANQWAQDSCTTSETFIRMRFSPSFFLPTFDHESISGVAPLDCLRARQLAGDGFFTAVDACNSPESPVARVRAHADHTTGTYVGNLTIDDAGDVATHGCVQAVQGDLTIAGPWTLDVAMPALQSVSGDLSVDYPRQPNETHPEVRAAQLPALTTVGADLILTSAHPGGGSQIVSMPYGMNALTTIGGDIDINVETFNTSASGFSALTHHAGNLSVVTGTGDTSGFFNALLSVDGDVYLDLGHTLVTIMGSLQTVGGDFTLLDGNPTPGVLDALASVGGDFTLGTVAFNGPPAQLFFPALADVTGRVTLDTTNLDVVNIGATPLQAGALTLTTNAGIDDLGPGDVQVIGGGSIEFINNSNLCLSTINAFLAGQLGWNGGSVISGNDDGC